MSIYIAELNCKTAQIQKQLLYMVYEGLHGQNILYNSWIDSATFLLIKVMQLPTNFSVD